MMTVPEFRAADRRRGRRFLAAATGAVLLVTAGWLTAVYALGPAGLPFNSDWLVLLALGLIFATYAPAVWAADRWAGRLACRNCRAVFRHPTLLIAERRCQRCGTPALADPDRGEPAAPLLPAAEVETAARREMDRAALTDGAVLVGVGVTVFGVVLLHENGLLPGWFAVGLGVVAVPIYLLTSLLLIRRGGRTNAAGHCPHCRRLLFAVHALRRSGRCGSCGRVAVSDPPAGLALPGPAGYTPGPCSSTSSTGPPSSPCPRGWRGGPSAPGGTAATCCRS